MIKSFQIKKIMVDKLFFYNKKQWLTNYFSIMDQFTEKIKNIFYPALLCFAFFFNRMLDLGIDIMSNPTLSGDRYNVKFTFFPVAPPTLLCIYFHDRGANKISSPLSSVILIFISIRVEQTNRREKMRLELAWISSSLPGLKQDIFPIQLFWFSNSNFHLIFPHHKVEIQGRTKKLKPSELYFVNPTEQPGLVFYNLTCWHWHQI